MKYLGIDFGSKKVGFAESDADGRMAFPLMIAPNDHSLVKDTLELIREMKFGAIVIGESVDQKGKPNEIAKKARAFAASIEQSIDIHIYFEKEWFSTIEARKQPGKEKEREVDDSAAALILQRFLDKVNGPGISSGDITESDDEDTNDRDLW